MVFRIHSCAIALCLLPAACFEYSAQVEENQIPVAVVAESLINADIGETVLLDGSASFDDDGDSLRYRWYQVGGETRPVTITLANQAVASITVPASRGSLFFALEVDDGISPSSPALIEIKINNRAPTVLPIQPATTTAGHLLSVLAQASDPDNDPITYLWTLNDWPAGGEIVLSNITSQSVSLTPAIPTLASEPNGCVPGDCYVLGVRAFDGELWSEEIEVTVIAFNRPPVANAGENQFLQTGTILLDASDSFDADGDALSYTWSRVEGPSVDLSDQDTSTPFYSLSVQEAGAYVFEVAVNDGQSQDTDSVRFDVTQINLSPTVVATTTTYLEPENQSASLSVSTSDPEGDSVAVFWHREEGSELWPAAMSGEDITLPIPKFDDLAAYDDNWVRYRVTASDGLSSSLPVYITVYSIPDDSGHMFLSTDGSAVDDPACGTKTMPCASVNFALSLMGGGSGDGRHMILLNGTYLQNSGSNEHAIYWPANTNLYGGRDPSNYSQTGVSVISTSSGILFNFGVLFDVFSGPNTLIRDITFQAVRGTHRPDQIVDCNQCQARFVNVTINCQPANAVRGLRLRNNAEPLLEDFDVACQGVGSQNTMGIQVLSGSVLEIQRGTLEYSAAQDGSKNVLVEVDSTATAIIDSAILKITGSDTSTTYPARAIHNNGNVVLQNTVVQIAKDPPFHGLHNSGVLTALHNTMIGPGGPEASGVGIWADGQVALVGNIAASFPLTFELSGAGLNSELWGNAFFSAQSTMATCDDVEVDGATFINSQTGDTCNQSGTSWQGNIMAACPLMSIATGDFHLNRAIDNPCVDAGLSATSAGNPPAFDIDGDPRPSTGTAPDIGSDEGNSL